MSDGLRARAVEDAPIAIIGIGCRFPGDCHDPAAYWKLLSTGGDAIREIPADRWDPKLFFDPDPGKPGKTNTRWGGFVNGIDLFDASFFGISPREASRMDPQQRVILEVAYEALEDAGQDLARIAGSDSAVFVGISSFDYATLQTDFTDRTAIEGYNSTGNALSIAANRISYIFDFRGPSAAVDTACSSALTAVHLACQSIWKQGCPLALAGGVSILAAVDPYIGFSRLGMLSPDGRCKAFDAKANGYVRSEGAGIVVLKPLAQALIDGDRIYATISGTAINQDGRSSGLTVPNQQSQEALVREACRRAGLLPEQIQYIEAHGTGTPVGDPIEARALGSVLSVGRPSGDYCVMGSVKTNIGHLEAASGIAGLIKTTLALDQRLIPPSLHFETPNPDIPFEEMRLRVARELEPWPAPAGKANAGINSFGFGGSNAHVVLSEAPRSARSEPIDAPAPWLIPLSARTPEGLRAVADSYLQFLVNDASVSVPNLSYNAARRRTHYDHRFGVICGTREELIDALRAGATGQDHPSVVSDRVLAETPKLLWVFCGQGPQWWAMGRQLLEREPVFRDIVRRCCDLIGQWSDWSLWNELTAEPSQSRLDDTAIAQPAIFAIQAGLTALWQSWGIQPGAIVGHSVGEVAAAYAAGVLTLEDAILVIFHRARCMQFAKGGGRMLAVGLSLEESHKTITPYDGRVGVAAINGPTSITLSGDAEPLEEIARAMERDGVFCRFLSSPYAFHSAQMDAAEKPLCESLRDVRPQPSHTLLFSTVTGEAANGLEWGADYWWQNVRRPVRFADAVGRASDAGYHVALELGPHPVLGGSILECFQKHGVKGRVLPSLRRDEDERRRMIQSLGTLYTLGCTIHWETASPTGHAISLPTYPWQRERHWNESEDSSQTRLGTAEHPLLGHALKTPFPTWESRVGTGLQNYLKDHCLQDQPLVPATAYLEMALSAAKVVFPEGPYAIEEVRFAKGCFLDDGQTLNLQTMYRPADSSFQICSRVNGNGHSWTLHTSGILRSRRFNAPPKLDLDSVIARCPQEIGPAVCYPRLKEMGLRYGDSFQGIKRLWCGKGEALGQIELPGIGVNAKNDYTFHPALLDSCIQVLFGAMAILAANDSRRHEVYLPVECAEVRVHGVPGDRLWSYARLTEKTRQGISADVLVFDSSGDLVWEARGLGCKQLNLEGGSKQGTDALAYEYRWQFQPRPVHAARNASFLRPPALVGPEVRAAAARLRSEGRLVDRHGRFETATDSLCASYAWDAVHRMAGPLPNRFTTDSLANELGLAPEHRRQLELFLSWFEEDGTLRRTNPGWELVRPPASENPQETWRKVFTEQPSSFPEMMLIGRVGRNLVSLLRGELNPLQVILPEGSLNTLEHLYQDARYGRYHALVARHAIDRMLATLPAGRTLRVLEVGAGTGSLTAHVLPSLPLDRTEYAFTDASPHFFPHGQQKFQDYPFVRYELLDIESAPAEQGFAPNTFDLVLASSVLHATADIRQTLVNVKNLLSSEGSLVMIETARRMRWVDMIFGMTEGWWRFTDSDLRTDHPLLSAPKWEALLAELGFGDVQDVSDSEETDLGAAVIIARGPRLESVEDAAIVSQTTATPPGQWMLFADRGGSAERLARLMAERGRKCEVLFPEHTTSSGNGSLPEPKVPDALLPYLKKGEAPPQGVVYMWGLDAPEADELETEALEAAQAFAALQLVSIVNALSDAAAEIPLYVVTRRAFSVGRDSDPVELTQSPLIGLCRVIMNEYPKLRCTTIDLGGVESHAELRALADELCAPETQSDHEDEIAFRGEIRYVHRYTQYSTARQVPTTASETESFRLEVDTSNTIDGLALRASQRKKPGADEVEIEVVAAGLNFSDVLKALGLYPGLPEGPVPLGIECSGRIAAVGERVSEFHVGDAVAALAPYTFSSHVTVDAGLVAPVPPHLSFEEAATIPIAFLTAHYALHHLGHMEAGEKVLIHSASGGVGLAAIQLARAAGAEILVTAGTAEKRFLLEELGIKDVLDSRSLTFADEVLERTDGRGVDIVLNSLPGDAISKGLSILADYGRFLEIGKRDIYQNSRLGMAPFRKNLSFIAIDLDRAMRRSPALIARQSREVAARFHSGKLFPLPHRTFPVTNIRGAFRYMAHGKHIGKVVVSFDGRRPAITRGQEQRQLFSPGSTYLVTGGLGGFGMSVARWLVEQGARHIVLVGRHGITTAEAEAGVTAMRQAGAEVVVHCADISKSCQVAEVLARIDKTMPPLRGVMHAAMVLDDCGLLNLTPERWRKVLAPKVGGAWNLHLQTQHLPLDFFVSFSSISAAFGIAGQANYAAANTFLDSLAAYRRARGLAALTVNWGYVGEVGYVARNEKIGQRFETWGLLSVSPKEALSMLGQLMEQGAHQIGVMRIDWANFRPPGLSDRLSPRFADLAARLQTDAGMQGTEGASARQLVLAAPDDQRKDLLESLLRSKVARVLGASASHLDSKKPLNELGLDSIMGVELRNWIADDLRVDLPVVELVRGPSIDHLVNRLIGQLTTETKGNERPSTSGLPENGSTRPAPQPVHDEVVERVAGLSDGEVDALLKVMAGGQAK